MNDSRKFPIAVIAGIASAIISMTLLSKLSLIIFPLPVVDPKNPEAVNEALQSPLIDMIVCLLSAFVGGIIATIIGGRSNRNAALIVGVVLAFLGMLNSVLIREPFLIALVILLLNAVGAYLGYFVFRRKIANAS